MDRRKTNDGWVQDHRPVPDVVALLGIPYAAAPFGGNRFRTAPRPRMGRSSRVQGFRPHCPAVGKTARGTCLIARRRGDSHSQHMGSFIRQCSLAGPGVDPRRCVHLRVLRAA